MKTLTPAANHLLRCLPWLWLLALAAAPAPAAGPLPGVPCRVVSLAPSTTEMLFALGLGERVVGVTRYCDYPPLVTSLPKIGGFFDPNYEQIVALEPDLGILLTSHTDARRMFHRLGIRTLVLPHRTVGDIHAALRMIGTACGAADKAAALVGDLRGRCSAVRRVVRGRPRPRVLICIARDTGSGRLAGMVAAGSGGFYHQIIETAGGVNTISDPSIARPQLSAEGVIALNPDVIIDLVDSIRPEGRSREDIARQWDALHAVTAVRRHQVHVVAGRYALRPGPRYVVFLEELARLLHPEAFAKQGTHD